MYAHAKYLHDRSLVCSVTFVLHCQNASEVIIEMGQARFIFVQAVATIYWTITPTDHVGIVKMDMSQIR